MTEQHYRVESTHPIIGPFSPPVESSSFLIHDRALAIVIAAKSITKPRGQEIRVVHTPSGQVVYRKTSTQFNTTSPEDSNAESRCRLKISGD